MADEEPIARRTRSKYEAKDDIKPEDSASNISNRSTSTTTSSQRAMIKEAELAVKLINMRESMEIKRKKTDSLRQRR